MANGPREAAQDAPGKRRTSRDAQEANGRRKLEIFLQRFPYLRELAHRLQRGGEVSSTVILFRVMTFHEKAGSLGHSSKPKVLDESRTPDNSNQERYSE